MIHIMTLYEIKKFFFLGIFQYLLLSYIICIFHSTKIIIVKIGSKLET